MATFLQVVGPLATPYLEDGARVYVYEGAFLPSGLREGEGERLLEMGLVAEVDVDETEDAEEIEGADNGATVDEELDITKGVDDVLAWVGENEEHALEALEAEQAKGDKARSTLVTALEAILDED